MFTRTVTLFPSATLYHTQRHLAVFSEARRGRPPLVLGSDQPAFPFDSAALNRAAAGNRLDVAAQVGQLLEVGDRDRRHGEAALVARLDEMLGDEAKQRLAHRARTDRKSTRLNSSH